MAEYNPEQDKIFRFFFSATIYIFAIFSIWSIVFIATHPFAWNQNTINIFLSLIVYLISSIILIISTGLHRNLVFDIHNDIGEYYYRTVFEKVTTSYPLTLFIFFIEFLLILGAASEFGYKITWGFTTYWMIISTFFLFWSSISIAIIIKWRMHVSEVENDLEWEKVRQGVFSPSDEQAQSEHFPPENEQFSGSDSEAGYGFDPSQFEDFQQHQKKEKHHEQARTHKPRKEAPRGFEDRHPDDAKIWAVIDDPNAPPNVRRTAFDKILQRQEKRTEGKKPKSISSSQTKRLPSK